MRNQQLLNQIVVLIVIAILGSPPLLVAQERQEDVSVRLRLLPVTVLDRDGSPMRGLTAENFELYVDGRPVSIRSVDEYDYGALRRAINEGREFTGADMPPRRIILVFDLLSSATIGAVAPGGVGDPGQEFRNQITPNSDDIGRARGIQMAKSSARRWVEEQMLPTDEVAVVSYYYSADLMQPFTKNKKNILRAIDNVSLPVNILGGDASATFQDLPEEFLEDSAEAGAVPADREKYRFATGYVRFYKRLGQLLSSLPGTKNVLLFSEGISVYEGSLSTVGALPEFREATMTLSSGNSRVNSIGISGLEKNRAASDEREFLSSIALDTGGQFMPSRARLDGALREATEGMDHFYEIFFSPDPEEGSGFHQVEVRVNVDGASVSAPRGYLGQRRFDRLSGTEMDVHMQQGFWRPLMNELGGEMTWNALPIRSDAMALHLRTFIPPEQVQNADTHTYRALFGMGRDGEKYDEIRWRAAARPGSNGAIQVDFLVPLPDGQSSFQFVIADEASGNRAYMMDGVQAVVPQTGIAMSPLYLLQRGEASAPVEVRRTKDPDYLTAPLPDAVIALASAPAAIPRAGEAVDVAFILRGPAFDAAGVQVTRGENRQVIVGENLVRTPVADGLELVRFTVTLPEWEAGELEIMPLYIIGNKPYGLQPSTVELRAMEQNGQ